MRKYHFTNKAITDLEEIWNYTIDKWSEQQADLYYRMLIDACGKIAGNPYIFSRNYDYIHPGLYGYQSQKHIIFYKILQDNDILIVRILHQRMDIHSRLK